VATLQTEARTVEVRIDIALVFLTRCVGRKVKKSGLDRQEQITATVKRACLFVYRRVKVKMGN
jgi:hypothetical protein